MSNRLLRLLPSWALEIYYKRLPKATTIPLGRFNGSVISAPYLNHLWEGKVFYPNTDKVVNIVAGKMKIEGQVSLVDGIVVINYPDQGLWDTLKPISTTRWLGRMQLIGPTVVWFTLERTWVL